MNNEKVYVMYLRKSRSDIEYEKTHPDYDTLARHEVILRNLAISQNYVIGKIYKEVVSGETIIDRPKIQEILAEIKQKKYEGILVVELSRLTRGDKSDQGYITKILMYTNTLVITPDKLYNLSNPKDKELFDEELTNASKELTIIKSRLSRGRLSSIYEGKFVGNITPYGYKKIKIESEKGFTLEEDTNESIVVKKIFELYTYNDLSINQIVKELDKLKFKPRNAENWSPSTIKDILKNPAYIGKIRWNNRKEIKSLDSIENICVSRPRNPTPLIVNGIHQGIISDELWNLTQNKLSKNVAPVQHNNIIKNPLAHLLVCQKCGKYMQRRPYNKRGQATTIQCTNPNCDNISSKLCIVESKIIQGLKHWLENYKVDEKSINTKKRTDNINIYKGFIKRLKESIKIEEKRLSKVCQAYEDGIYDDMVYKTRYKELKDSIETSNVQINEYQKYIDEEEKLLNDKKNIIPKLQNILDIYYKLDTDEEKNKLLKTVIEKVTYLKTTKALKKTDDPTDFKIQIFPKIPKY